MSIEFNALTSLRSDPILPVEARNIVCQTINTGDECHFYLLSFHRDRLIQACQAFDRDSKVLEGEAGLNRLKQELQTGLTEFTGSERQETPVKLRLEFTNQQNFLVTASYVPTIPLVTLYPESFDQVATLTSATYRVFISPLRSTSSLFTKYKTTNRALYDKQRSFLPGRSTSGKDVGILEEMLLVNDSGRQIMEGTITTPYFLRNGEWITPQEGCGGHLGVTRRWALMRSIAKEGIILAEDVEIGEIVILSNGVRGFGWGRIEALEA